MMRDTRPEPARPEEWFLVPLLLAAALAGYAVLRGADAGWDLLNYHIYNPFALLHKAPGTDWVAAQLQSFLPPTLDLLPYLIRSRFNEMPALVNTLLALPSVVAAVIAFRIGLLLLPPAAAASRWRWVPVLAALAFGATGASGLPTTGTSMGEMPGACFMLGGLLILMLEVDSARPRGRAVLAAGLLFGIGLGLKLTLAPYGVAAVLGFLLLCRASLPERAGHTLRLGLGTLAGALLSGGAWWLHLYRSTGNPIFPFFNNLFHSPWLPPSPMRDERFLPQGTLQTLFYPFHWAFQDSRLVSELALRDPRMALAYGAAMLCLAIAALGFLRGRPSFDRRAGCFLVFAVVSYALWQKQFSIFRYLAPLELLSGFLILLLLRPLLVGAWPRLLTGSGLAALAAATIAYTHYPDWGRARADGTAASVNRAVLPTSGMVLLLTPDPMAFVAAFTDPAVRFIGVNNNIVQPGSATLLARRVEAEVRGFQGPLWGLEGSDQPAVSVPATLDFYGLVRTGTCASVTGNLLLSPPLRLCRLERSGAPS